LLPSKTAFPSFVAASKGTVYLLTYNMASPLQEAPRSGQRGLSLLIQLLTEGADINAADRNGETLLFDAAETESDGIAQLLLEAGADVNAAAKSGVTPLHAAAAAGHAQVVQLLLQAGAKTDAAAKSGRNALYAAAVAGHHEVVQLLLQAGADVKV
jgi:ankyrin repeat protein